MSVLPRHLLPALVASVAAFGTAAADEPVKSPPPAMQTGAPGPASGTSMTAPGAPAGDEASRIVDLLQRRDTQSLDAILWMAKQREEGGRWADAAQLYELVADVWGPSRDISFKAARALALAGDWDRAVRWLDRIRESMPADDKESLLMQARIHAWGGHYQRAAELVTQARAAGVTSEEPYLIMADMLYWQGRNEEAKAQYALALQIAPQSPDAVRGAARNLLAMGERDEARRYLGALRDAGDQETIRMIEAPGDPGGPWPWRIDLAYTLALNLDRNNWHAVNAALSYTISPAVTLGIATDIQIREDLPTTEVDPYLAVFGAFRLADWFHFDAEIGFTVEPLFRPAFRLHVQPYFVVADWLEVYGYYTLWDFNNADATGAGDLWINQVGPGLLFHAGPVDIDVSYRASIYSEDIEVGHLGNLRVDWRVIPELRIFAGAAYGSAVEVFFEANAAVPGTTTAIIQDSLTTLAGIGLDLHPQHSVDLTWAYWTTDPNRDNLPVVGIFQHSLTAHYAVRF